MGCCAERTELWHGKELFFREDLAYDSGAALEGSPAGVGG